MHKSIINNEIESKDSDIKIIFRTIMLLFSNEEYKVVIDKITNNKNIFLNREFIVVYAIKKSTRNTFTLYAKYDFISTLEYFHEK